MDVGQRLEQAKAQHRNRPLYNSHLRNQRQISDFAPRDLQERWFNGMKLALNEIDWATHGAVFPDAGPFLFLDIGCCPGGFSSYVLEKNPDARGVGISLPTPAGHDYLLEDDLRPRHELIWADILRYSFGAANTSPSPGSVPLPWGLRCRQFDLVLLDGHPLRTQTHAAHAVGTRLLAAQLLIALQSVRLLQQTRFLRSAAVDGFSAAGAAHHFSGVSTALPNSLDLPVSAQVPHRCTAPMADNAAAITAPMLTVPGVPRVAPRLCVASARTGILACRSGLRQNLSGCQTAPLNCGAYWYCELLPVTWQNGAEIERPG